jgi:hypothetical protein
VYHLHRHQQGAKRRWRLRVQLPRRALHALRRCRCREHLELELPKNFRPFDYHTISDVVITLNYTALADAGLRAKVEAQSAQAEGAILNYLSQHPLVRVFSLRQEFPIAYKQLVSSPPRRR